MNIVGTNVIQSFFNFDKQKHSIQVLIIQVFWTARECNRLQNVAALGSIQH